MSFYVIDMNGAEDEATFQSYVNAAPENVTVLVKTCNVSLVNGINFRKPGHFLFEAGSHFTLSDFSSANDGLCVRSSSVTLEAQGPVAVTGPRTSATTQAQTATNNGLSAKDLAGADLFDVAIKGPFKIKGWNGAGIRPTRVTNLRVEGVEVADCSYAGVMLNSCKYAWIERNRVVNIGLPQPITYAENAYGIAASNDNQLPVSESVWIRNNQISGVVTWHGIDTHGGRNVVIEGNLIEAVRDGIYITPQNRADGGVPLLAPENVKILNNSLVGRSANASGFGILVSGDYTNGNFAKDILIEGNKIEGFGWLGTSGQEQSASIGLESVLGYVVTGNVIKNGRFRGITVSAATGGSQSFGVITSNFIGPIAQIQTSASQACLYLYGAYNSVIIDNNTFYYVNMYCIYATNQSPSSNYQVRVGRANNYSYSPNKYASSYHIDADASL
ncbi:right-handed parallel beta-helix repeat-containing protein [Microvirga puerhi]|uniref:Right-handed parallel beta-helix repeat-containing protein n=1 Tax=Microvirga puerhi TaxID=2876078 RepID=A0ABS7VLH4_9HYPH|nr:right-handed parallel beta-helix repeat-containing protein [Microvirga puerhi]MBZ6076397.1 right-handed parallel beta-helix repeat-containing protein [Microvirga puerhi]